VITFVFRIFFILNARFSWWVWF